MKNQSTKYSPKEVENESSDDLSSSFSDANL